MSHINWDTPFFFDPSTGQSAPPGTEGAVPFPTYGNYGGAGYSARQFAGKLLAHPDGTPYSYNQLVQIGNDAQDPADGMDYLFYRHDVGSAATVGYTNAQAEADAALLNGLVKLNTDYDPEASLYAGATELAMIGELGIHEKLGLLSPSQALAALKDAAHDLQFGLDHLPKDELSLALNAIFHPTSDPNVFRFDFAVTTDSLAQEFYEMSVMKSLSAILNMGESHHAPLDTGFPHPGTTEYGFTYNTVTHHLDLVN
jgi:hypothetical protein